MSGSWLYRYYEPLESQCAFEKSALCDLQDTRYQPEKPLFIVHIRHDQRIYDTDTAFSYSWSVSTHQSRHRLNVNFLEGDSVQSLLDRLALACTTGAECIWITGEDVFAARSMLELSMRFLLSPSATDYDGIRWGALTTPCFTRESKLLSVGKLLPLEDPPASFDDLQSKLGEIQNPASLLGPVVLKTSGYKKLIEALKTDRPTTREELYQRLFALLLAPRPILSIRAVNCPQVGLPIEQPGRKLLEDVKDLLTNREHARALQILRSFRGDSLSLPGYHYYLGVAHYLAKNLWEARKELERQLQLTPEEQNCLSLLADINGELPEHHLEYADVRPTIETVGGLLSPGQEQFLHEKVASLPENAVVAEIGIFKGRSTIAMAFACVDTERTIYAVDSWKHNMFQVRDIFEFNLKRLDLEKYVTIIEGHSLDVFKEWGSRPKIDFVFIDGSHDYDSVLRDFSIVYPHVNVGGWIGFHDICLEHPGSWRFWRETASKVLIDHEFQHTIACGRKISVSYEPPVDASDFSYADALIDVLVEEKRDAQIIAALRTSRVSPGGSESVERAERTIATLPEKYRYYMKSLLHHDEIRDGFLHYWYALMLADEQKWIQAEVQLRRAQESKSRPDDERLESLSHQVRSKRWPKSETSVSTGTPKLD